MVSFSYFTCIHPQAISSAFSFMQPQIIFQNSIGSLLRQPKQTRMHSSRMRTARGSSRQLGGVCLSACWDTHLLPVWAWSPCQPDPSTSPLGVGLETPLWRPARHAGIPPPETCKACWDTTCKECWDTTPPGDLQGMLGYHLQGMLGYHPPVDRQTRVKT